MSGCFIGKWVNDLIIYSKIPTMTIEFWVYFKKIDTFLKRALKMVKSLETIAVRGTGGVEQEKGMLWRRVGKGREKGDEN